MIVDAVASRDRGCCWTDGDFTQAHPFGYPRVGQASVSHLVMTLDGRSRPEGLHALHSCDQPACWNPDHLRWGTQAQNMADKFARGRQAKGERVGSAKLTEIKVREIRARYAAGGVSQRKLATEYGIEQTMISRIVMRKAWKHLD